MVASLRLAPRRVASSLCEATSKLASKLDDLMINEIHRLSEKLFFHESSKLVLADSITPDAWRNPYPPAPRKIVCVSCRQLPHLAGQPFSALVVLCDSRDRAVNVSTYISIQTSPSGHKTPAYFSIVRASFMSMSLI